MPSKAIITYNNQPQEMILPRVNELKVSDSKPKGKAKIVLDEDETKLLYKKIISMKGTNKEIKRLLESIQPEEEQIKSKFE